MALMRTSNPALNAKTFADLRRDPTAPAMTVEGTVNRTAFLLFLVVLPAAWVWAQVRTALDTSVAGPCIVVSGIIVVVAALNLILDFDFIESGAAAGAPKYMEWYGAFGLMVTLIWLYLEILRLLAKSRSRR